MDMSPVVRFVGQAPGHGDCGVASLAMLMGISYEQSLVACARVAKNVLTTGVNWSQLRQAAKLLGATLVERRKFSLESDSEDTGILSICWQTGTFHAVFFSHGLIFDGRTDCAWEPDTFLAAHNATVTTMLVRTA